jgi:hypothetical protein
LVDHVKAEIIRSGQCSVECNLNISHAVKVRTTTMLMSLLWAITYGPANELGDSESESVVDLIGLWNKVAPCEGWPDKAWNREMFWVVQIDLTY